MTYSSGMLNHRVEILRRVQKDGSISRNSGAFIYETVMCVACNVTWKRGQKSLNEGEFDSQDTVMFRMRWNNIVTRNSFLRYDGAVYQIQSLHADRQDDTMQIIAIETVTK